MASDAAPLELLSESCPELLLERIAPRLRAADIGHLRGASRRLCHFVDVHLRPLRVAWLPALAVAHSFNRARTGGGAGDSDAADESDSTEAGGDVTAAAAAVGPSSATSAASRDPHELRALRFMLQRVLPMQGQALGTQAAFALLAPRVVHGDFEGADLLLAHLGAQARLREERARLVWLALAWDIVTIVAAQPGAEALAWLLQRLDVLRVEDVRARVVAYLAERLCFLGHTAPLERLLQEPTAAPALRNDDEPVSCLTHVLVHGHLAALQLLMDSLQLRVADLPAAGLAAVEQEGRIDTLEWLAARRDAEQAARRELALNHASGDGGGAEEPMGEAAEEGHALVEGEAHSPPPI